MSRPSLTPETVALVALGGALGAVLRWTIGEAVPEGSGFPWTTFSINVIGSFGLALLPLLSRYRRVVLALGPGLLGGFTTLSAYAEQGRALIDHGQVALALTYLVGTLGSCLLAVHVASGLTTARERSTLQAEGGDE